MRARIAKWMDDLAGLGALPDDSDEERLHKTILTLSAVFVTILSCVWVASYWLLGHRLSALIPLTYQVVTLLSLLHFFRTKRYPLFRLGQLWMMLVLPFLLQWTLGGFVASSGVMLWAVTAPLGALLFYGPQQSIPWFAAYAGLTIISGILDPYLAQRAAPMPPQVIRAFFVLNIAAVSATVFLLLQYFAREKARAMEATDRLLLNILPQPIARRLKLTPGAIADGFGEVTVLFADIVDFTRISAGMQPIDLVACLNRLFTSFDRLAQRHDLEKIKTVGDAYMVVGGLPTPRPEHAQAVAEMALDMQAEITRHLAPNGEEMRMRIGIHTGPVVAGVIGEKKFIYDLWGDTVNTASRMESHGVPGSIQVSEDAYRLLRGRYAFERRGSIPIKGKGEMMTYLLIGRASLPDGHHSPN